jgi:hypothetical protein
MTRRDFLRRSILIVAASTFPRRLAGLFRESPRYQRFITLRDVAWEKGRHLSDAMLRCPRLPLQ